MTDLNDLHKLAGAEGLDVRVKARTDHDELSEYSKATVEVTLPAEGATVVKADRGEREARLQDVLDQAAEDALSGLQHKIDEGELVEYVDAPTKTCSICQQPVDHPVNTVQGKPAHEDCLEDDPRA